MMKATHRPPQGVSPWLLCGPLTGRGGAGQGGNHVRALPSVLFFCGLGAPQGRQGG